MNHFLRIPYEPIECATERETRCFPGGFTGKRRSSSGGAAVMERDGCDIAIMGVIMMFFCIIFRISGLDIA